MWKVWKCVRTEINVPSRPSVEAREKLLCISIGGESGYHHFVKHVFSIAEHFHIFHASLFLFVSILHGWGRLSVTSKRIDLPSFAFLKLSSRNWRSFPQQPLIDLKSTKLSWTTKKGLIRVSAIAAKALRHSADFLIVQNYFQLWNDFFIAPADHCPLGDCC